MSKVHIQTIFDHDHLQPIRSGSVRAETAEIAVVPKTGTAVPEPFADVFENSMLQYSYGVHHGVRDEWIGIPYFPLRGFEHRAVWVRRGSDITSFAALSGRTVATEAWGASGNTWCRAAIREAGVDLSTIRFVVYPKMAAPFDRTIDLPDFVSFAAEGAVMADALTSGEVDAVCSAGVPMEWGTADSDVVRVIADFESAERGYFGRTGIFPAMHVFNARRSTFENDPELLRTVAMTLEESRKYWDNLRFRLSDTVPWLRAELEEVRELIGPQWRAGGLGPNRKMIDAFCAELVAQGFVDQALSADELFGDYRELVGD
jgi:4,5-dihydroxyphthalate decarboxylase